MQHKYSCITIIISILSALLLGVYAQSIASFLTDRYYILFLTIVTIASISLFVLATIIQLNVLMTTSPKSRIMSTLLTILLFGTVAVGLYVSWWALFVLGMSWG